jgi:cobalt-zinc-cadmium efflux system membrane fusion protein
MRQLYSILLVFSISVFISCKESHQTNDSEEHEIHPHEEGVVHLSELQFESLGMKLDTLPMRQMKGYIQSNGQLILPPQSEASITAVVGANIKSIKVIEGDKVSKGQVVAYVRHPDIISLQTVFVKKQSDLEYAEQEYQRRKKLFEENVSSGKEFQKVKSEYLGLKADVSGMEKQLELLGLPASKIKEGEIFTNVPLRSPIPGYIRKVNVRLGQYVEPNQKLIEVVNNDHIHGHFLVYEKDIMKVRKGQKVMFTVESIPDREFEAEVFSVGKVFESGPKAIELHAEINNEDGRLISGMYVRGRIIVNEELSMALPEEAVVREGNRSYIFKAHKEADEWEFKALEVREGVRSDAWTEIKLMKKAESKSLFAWNNAYYLFSEWKKEEAGHDH